MRKKADVADLQKVLVEASQKAGKRVNSLVNQDSCRIAEDLYDEYADMVAYMVKHHYEQDRALCDERDHAPEAAGCAAPAWAQNAGLRDR